MREIRFPYGKRKISYRFPEDSLVGVLQGKLNQYEPDCSQEELVEKAMENPIGSAGLAELSRGKQNIVIIASDHTRPVPSRILMPAMLKEIRRGNPEAEITILIATGCHRETTKQESGT